MKALFQNIPTTECVRKVGPGEGEKFDIGGAHLTWKVKGEDSGYAFSICEQTLAPGEGVPLHCHVSAEAFYVLSGAADFFRVVDGKEDRIPCRFRRHCGCAWESIRRKGSFLMHGASSFCCGQL